MSEREIGDCLEVKFKELGDRLEERMERGIKRQMWLTVVILGAFLTIILFVGAFTVENGKAIQDTKNEIREIRSDGGHILMELSSKHPESLVLENFYRKYNPYRGAK